MNFAGVFILIVILKENGNSKPFVLYIVADNYKRPANNPLANAPLLILITNVMNVTVTVYN